MLTRLELKQRKVKGGKNKWQKGNITTERSRIATKKLDAKCQSRGIE